MDSEKVEATRLWREAFAEGIKHFHRRQFAPAEQKFGLAIQLRLEADQNSQTEGTVPREDGPSRFYLERIVELKGKLLDEHWQGEIEMADK